jgi:LMBR1 domain-containing protein 1
MALLVLLFLSSSVVGIATIGIRFLWVKILEIRKARASPQALLVTTVLLNLIMLAVNYSIVTIVSPQYAIYGAQTFCQDPLNRYNEQSVCSKHPELIKPCSELSSNPEDVCTPTVVSTFLNRVTLNFPFFGTLDFWAQFAFLAVFLIVFVTSLFRAPKLDLSRLDEDAEADEEEGLLASTGRRFGATWQDIRGSTRGSRASATGRGSRGDNAQ